MSQANPESYLSNAQAFDDAEAAVDCLVRFYDDAVNLLLDAFADYRQDVIRPARVRQTYPGIYVNIEREAQDFDTRSAFGFCHAVGEFGTTITRPGLFREYLLEQLHSILMYHQTQVWVGFSGQPLPIHFAMQNDIAEFTKDMAAEKVYALRNHFDVPNLANIDDAIADGAHHWEETSIQPLSLFSAQRTDYALHRLKHYTGSEPEHFQPFVLFTNYQFYVEEFIKFGRSAVEQGEANSGYHALVEPGNVIYRMSDHGELQIEGIVPGRTPQMPAYHLKRRDGQGITLVNIGVGPSNAKTITDHIAVLRPHCWLMLGHCAGLRNTQRLGDYVLAHAYLREDNVLSDILPVSVPIPAIAEVQTALHEATEAISGLNDYELKRLVRTGTVATVDDRNWELLNYPLLMEKFSQSRAIALDMESATIAANGFRYRVPYGTLLCVSDKPMHGEIKLPGMADHFYRERVSQHLQIGIRAMELLRAIPASLHSRKLRTFAEPAFR